MPNSSILSFPKEKVTREHANSKVRRWLRLPLLLSLDALVDFLSMHGNVLRRSDAEAHLIACRALRLMANARPEARCFARVALQVPLMPAVSHHRLCRR
jgi:hypothetical protein